MVLIQYTLYVNTQVIIYQVPCFHSAYAALLLKLLSSSIIAILLQNIQILRFFKSIETAVEALERKDWLKYGCQCIIVR